MPVYKSPGKKELKEILKRPGIDQAKISKIVRPILDKVKRSGDDALKKLALEYDHVELDSLWVSEAEFATADAQVQDTLKEAIQVAYANIKKFHEAQKQDDLIMEVMPGVICSRRSVPIQKVGLYIPGGTAPLFSTVLMLAIPAKIAGCKEIILASPTNRLGEINPVVLYTAKLVGVDKVLKVGGAQAIAAMAYGTETVPKVHKIFGPGNQYVTAAKQLVAQTDVAIDMPAGPSEVLVVVDESSDAAFAAADLLSQAEHGGDSQVVLISTSVEKAEEINAEVEAQLEKLYRKDMAGQALEKSSVIVESRKEKIIKIINKYGPEHLIINTQDAEEIAEQVSNAGSVFIGAYTPESAGDYASGTNHTLPTNGWAKSFSGVSLDSYVKKITYQKIDEEGLLHLGPTIERMAEAEMLEAHKNAVTIRLKKLREDGISAATNKKPHKDLKSVLFGKR
ncbi:histidinol dehydrogenase [Marinoscillum sp. MHG1-6]|uniref:histidinol dehydrogenase n=1 Tax=Marinoscillum sp. MHG1-6 TaxID=2959627 RepID=UPI0035BE68C4